MCAENFVKFLVMFIMDEEFSLNMCECCVNMENSHFAYQSHSNSMHEI